MLDQEIIEILDLPKKDASSENSSMLKGVVILEALAPCYLGTIDANHAHAKSLIASHASYL